MSNFENICCKVLGIILILLLSILSLQLMGCASKSAPLIEEPHDTIRDYPLLDSRGILHKYREDFDKIIFPKHNEKLTQYCGTHFQWENIKAVYKREKNSDYRWHYIVSKHPKD